MFSAAVDIAIRMPTYKSVTAHAAAAIFLIVTFTVYGVNFLIAAFIYALIALITAYIVKFFGKIENRTIQINLIKYRLL